MTTILPDGVLTRWQQALEHDAYREWSSYSDYLMGLSRNAFNEGSRYIASDLLFLSNVAHQIVLDMEPKREAA